MALNLYCNVWTMWEIFYNEVGLVNSPSMIPFCKLFVQKGQKMLPKMIYWSPHRPINGTGPRQLILTSNIKHHKTRSNIGIALSAVQYLGGLRMDARTLKEANFREGRDHYYYNWTIGQWILTAPVILLLSSDIYSATTFNFFPFYIQCIIHSQQDAVQLYLCS